MPQIGPLEILVVLLVALIVFGPEKLPDMARKVGRAASELKRMASDVKSEFDTSFDVEDEPPKAGPVTKRRFDYDDSDEPPLARGLDENDGDPDSEVEVDADSEVDATGGAPRTSTQPARDDDTGERGGAPAPDESPDLDDGGDAEPAGAGEPGSRSRRGEVPPDSEEQGA